MSPEAPVPVVRVEDERAAIGGAGNVAANIAALGARCAVVGCVGDDVDGRALRQAFATRGVETQGVVQTATRPTTVKTRVMARHQQIVRFDREDESNVADELAEGLRRAIRESGPVDVVVMEDYNKGVLVPSVIEAVMERARELGVPTVVDPKRRNFFAFSGVTVFKPNAKELEDALGTFIHPDDPSWMTRTRERLGCEQLLLTLGEKGMALEGSETGHVRVPAVARAVYDVSGAGDTVTGVVATVLAGGGSPLEAAVLANHAAAVEVTKTGVATVTPQEILQHIDSQPNSSE